VRIGTHVAIGRAISRQLGLDPYLEKCFIRGLRRPDLRVKQGRRVRSHHGIHPDSIMSIVWSARRVYLAGDYERSLEHLGVALHYVQDKCVVWARRRLRRVHNRVEGAALSLELPVEAMREGFGRAECSAIFVKSILYSIKPSADPVEALRNACYYSALVAGAVYNPSKPSRDLLEKYEEAKAVAAKWRGIRRFLVSALALVFWGLLILYPHLLAIYFIAVLFSLPLLFYSGVDPRLREELAWYGLE
jgi:hypothetical protein